MLDATKQKKTAKEWAFGEWRPAPPRPLLLRLQEVGRPADLCYGLILLLIFLAFVLWAHAGSALFTVGALFAMCAFTWGYTLLKRWSNESIRDLMDIPSVIAQYPVDVQFLSNGAQYGSDKGIVSFVDGAMHFQGFRCSFNFPVERARISMLQQSEERVLANSIYNIPWYEDGFFGVVRIKPIDTLQGVGDTFATKFWFAYRDWDSERMTGPDRCLLPPRTPLPQAMERYVVELIAASLAVLFTGAGLWLFLGTFGMGRITLFAAFLVLLVAYACVKTPCRALTSLMRMRQRGTSATELLENVPEGSIHDLGLGFARSRSAAEDRVKA